jgi:hypothetical protein
MSLEYSGWVLAKSFVHFLAMYLRCTGSGHHPLPPVSHRPHSRRRNDLRVLASSDAATCTRSEEMPYSGPLKRLVILKSMLGGDLTLTLTAPVASVSLSTHK